MGRGGVAGIAIRLQYGRAGFRIRVGEQIFLISKTPKIKLQVSFGCEPDIFFC
jgi:hypothetical protein